MVAWWPLPCNIIVADRGQHKVEVVAKKKKIGNNQPEVWQHEWWRSNCHAISSWQAAGSTKWKWQQKKKKGNNQLEVWQHEWWHGSHCHASSLQQAGASTKWKWWQKRKKVTINWRCGSMSGGVVAAAVQYHHGRQRAAQSGSGSKKKRKREQSTRGAGCTSGGMVALPCDIVAAGSEQCQVEVAAKKEKR